MTHEEYIEKIAGWFCDNTLSEILPYCAPDVVYITGYGKVMLGLDSVREFLQARHDALVHLNAQQFAYPGTVTESPLPGVPVGSRIVILFQQDPYNCAGFMMLELNEDGTVKKIHFHTEPEVKFSSPKRKFGVADHVPKDAHDAIMIRACGFGLAGEGLSLSKHIRQYDTLRPLLQQLYDYIYHCLFDNFNQGLDCAAGYTYVAGMIEAINRERPDSISFTFVPEDACKGIVPDVPEKYLSYIQEGYRMGQKLFLGFSEYIKLREPKGEHVFERAMMNSFKDVFLWGATRANKDMDMGLI